MGLYDQPRSPDYDASIEDAKKENARLRRQGVQENTPLQPAIQPTEKQRLFAEQDAKWKAHDAENERTRPERERRVEKVRNDNASFQGVTIVCANTIPPVPIDWIWSGYLAAGKLHILAGMAGTGKTTIALALAATMTTNGRWPDGTACRTARDVIFWSGEDDPADTLVPRLLAMGADLSRIHFVTTTKEDGSARPFDPSTDMPLLLEELTKYPNAGMLILDPISTAVIGDSHQNTVVRRSLQPVVDLAAKVKCAVLGITHFSKGTSGKDPLERVTGSLAFGALARMVLSTIKPGKDADDQKRRLIRAKSNIGPDGGGFEYSLIQTNVPGHADLYASCILWGEALEGSARELADQIEGDGSGSDECGPSPREEAKDFLLDMLGDGPRMQAEIRELADQEGIAIATLKRAKKDLGIVSTKLADGWQWKMKNWVDEDQGDQEDHNSKPYKIDTLDTLESGKTAGTLKNQPLSQEDQGDHIPEGNTLMDGEV